MKQLGLLLIVVAACGKVQGAIDARDLDAPDVIPPPVKITVLTYAGDLHDGSQSGRLLRDRRGVREAPAR
ncbi:MAG TPA: hypothetical protein VN253_21440 [Kofleriaceae bacterium]|nr:hypothetical protein [Kofleriaceae bacterium]